MAASGNVYIALAGASQVVLLGPDGDGAGSRARRPGRELRARGPGRRPGQPGLPRRPAPDVQPLRHPWGALELGAPRRLRGRARPAALLPLRAAAAGPAAGRQLGVRHRQRAAAPGRRTQARPLRPRGDRRRGGHPPPGERATPPRDAGARLPVGGHDRARPELVRARASRTAWPTASRSSASGTRPPRSAATGRLIARRVAPANPRQGLRRPLPRQHRHDRDPSPPGAGDAPAGGGARPPGRRRAAVLAERGGRDRAVAPPLRRLEPRGRDAHLRLRQPPLRARAASRAAGRQARAQAHRSRAACS